MTKVNRNGELDYITGEGVGLYWKGKVIQTTMDGGSRHYCGGEYGTKMMCHVTIIEIIINNGILIERRR